MSILYPNIIYPNQFWKWNYLKIPKVSEYSQKFPTFTQNCGWKFATLKIPRNFASLVIGLQLFIDDPYNENLTKLAQTVHTYTHVHTYTQTGMCSCKRERFQILIRQVPQTLTFSKHMANKATRILGVIKRSFDHTDEHIWYF